MDLERAKEILSLTQFDTVGKLLELADAFWVYREREGEPHAILAKGSHSDGYINLNAVLMFPNACEILARNLIRKLKESGICMEEKGAVVSSTFAAVGLGQEVARQWNAAFVFTEKDGEEQKWGGRFELPKGLKILQVEELTTTVSTPRKVKAAVDAANPDAEFVQFDGKTVLATVVYRPDHLPAPEPDYHIVALMEIAIHSWPPENCPLCQKGSTALKPKQHWQEFAKFQRQN